MKSRSVPDRANGLLWRRGLAACLLVASLASGASARDETPRERLRDLVRRATHIVDATVTGLDMPQDPEGRVWSVYTLDTAQVVKGEEPAPHRMVIFGGTLPDGSRAVMPGLPTFEEQDRLILLLGADGSLCPIVGGERGAFRVRGAGELATMAQADGMPIVGIGDDGRLRTGTESDPMTVSAFKRALLDLQQ